MNMTTNFIASIRFLSETIILSLLLWVLLWNRNPVHLLPQYTLDQLRALLPRMPSRRRPLEMERKQALYCTRWYIHLGRNLGRYRWWPLSPIHPSSMGPWNRFQMSRDGFNCWFLEFQMISILSCLGDLLWLQCLCSMYSFLYSLIGSLLFRSSSRRIV